MTTGIADEKNTHQIIREWLARANPGKGGRPKVVANREFCPYGGRKEKVPRGRPRKRRINE